MTGAKLSPEHKDLAWCGKDEEHDGHGACHGVARPPACGFGWSEHAQTRFGEPYCTKATCPGSGPGARLGGAT